MCRSEARTNVAEGNHNLRVSKIQYLKFRIRKSLSYIPKFFAKWHLC